MTSTSVHLSADTGVSLETRKQILAWLRAQLLRRFRIPGAIVYSCYYIRLKREDGCVRVIIRWSGSMVSLRRARGGARELVFHDVMHDDEGPDEMIARRTALFAMGAPCDIAWAPLLLAGIDQ